MEDEALRQVVLAAEEHPANAGVHKAIPAQKAFTILYHEDHHYLHRLPGSRSVHAALAESKQHRT